MYCLWLLLFAPAIAYSSPHQLPTDNFTAILEAQAQALEIIEAESINHKSAPGSFNLNELITDIGVTKSGLMGLTALKSGSAIEIKWKRKKLSPVIQEETAEALLADDFEVENQDLDQLSQSLLKMVSASGQIKITPQLKLQLSEILESISRNLQQIAVTHYGRWRASGLRVDLHFSASGQVFSTLQAGAALRIRMEWKLKDLPLKNSQVALINDQTRLVVKSLAELDQALIKYPLQGFVPKKVSLGVGVSRRQSFGLWKHSVGMLGFLVFVPVVSHHKSAAITLPPELLTADYPIGGMEEENEKLWPWRRSSISGSNFASGLQHSLYTAAHFAEQAQKLGHGAWEIVELKTSNDISRGGLFGLSDITSRGMLEIDFKRK